MPKFALVFTCLILLAVTSSFGQVYVGGNQTNGSESNNIVTAVPFLLIAPDARTGALGNAGVATPGDINSAAINPAKMAFLKTPYGVSASYSPWLKNLVPDVNLAYISGFYNLDDRNTIAASLRYFSLGKVQLTDINQQILGITNPNELAVDFTFARSFGEEFSLGSTLRFVSSNLAAGLSSPGQQARAGTALAMDIGGLYKTDATIFGKASMVSAGVNISNIGTKISYIDGGAKYFLPSNLKLGGAAMLNIDDYSSVTFALDLNKLLVPTQPIYDSNGNIVSGRDPNRSVPAGIFGSFSDAPGGFSEEMKEVGVSTGMEYWYNQQFALRVGYNYENPKKGNTSYITLGAGLKYDILNIDFAYVVADAQTNALANTLRFTLLFNFSGARSTAKP